MPAYDITCAEAVNRWSDFLDVSVFADRETVVDNQLIFRKLPRATRTNQKLLRANFLQAVIAVTEFPAVCRQYSVEESSQYGPFVRLRPFSVRLLSRLTYFHYRFV